MCYTIQMIMKEYEATYTNDQPSEYPHGRIILNRLMSADGSKQLAGIELCIMNWHTYSDIGNDLETVQVWSPATKRLFEIYSSDEGETFTFEMQEA